MPNAPPAEHVAYFRELFRHLDKEYIALVADYEMLKPTMEDVELCRRFSRVPETAGVLAVRNALFNQCILGTWRILRENQALNPSTIEDLMHSVARINRVARTHSNSLK
jgi:hypothetical protein